jgi:hypothetical protein
MTRWSEDDLSSFQRRTGSPVNAAPPIATRSKFKAIRVERNGQKFDSKMECSRWIQLEQLRDLGEIRDLRAQVSFPLQVNGEYLGCYVADAVYFDIRKNIKVVEDTKGVPTALFKWKAKHFAAQYGFDITIVSKA